MPHLYETDGAAIYLQSFAMIRAEADLQRFTPEEEVVAVRMIHAAGMVELAPYIRFTPGMAIAAQAALEDGAPILCDARMVSEGITRARLPKGNEVICTLHDPQVPALAKAMGYARRRRARALIEIQLKLQVDRIHHHPRQGHQRVGLESEGEERWHRRHQTMAQVLGQTTTAGMAAGGQEKAIGRESRGLVAPALGGNTNREGEPTLRPRLRPLQRAERTQLNTGG